MLEWSIYLEGSSDPQTGPTTRRSALNKPQSSRTGEASQLASTNQESSDISRKPTVHTSFALPATPSCPSLHSVRPGLSGLWAHRPETAPPGRRPHLARASGRSATTGNRPFHFNSFRAVAQRPPETGRFASGFRASGGFERRRSVARMFVGRNIQLRALPRRILCEGTFARVSLGPMR